MTKHLLQLPGRARSCVPVTGYDPCTLFRNIVAFGFTPGGSLILSGAGGFATVHASGIAINASAIHLIVLPVIAGGFFIARSLKSVKIRNYLT
jgi:hypothetical protein